MIETFNDMYDALLYIEVMCAETEVRGEPYFKAEIVRLPDKRHRVGLITEPQMEFKFENK